PGLFIFYGQEGIPSHKFFCHAFYWFEGKMSSYFENPLGLVRINSKRNINVACKTGLSVDEYRLSSNNHIPNSILIKRLRYLCKERFKRLHSISLPKQSCACDPWRRSS